MVGGINAFSIISFQWVRATSRGPSDMRTWQQRTGSEPSITPIRYVVARWRCLALAGESRYLISRAIAQIYVNFVMGKYSRRSLASGTPKTTYHTHCVGLVGVLFVPPPFLVMLMSYGEKRACTYEQPPCLTNDSPPSATRTPRMPVGIPDCETRIATTCGLNCESR